MVYTILDPKSRAYHHFSCDIAIWLVYRYTPFSIPPIIDDSYPHIAL